MTGDLVQGPHVDSVVQDKRLLLGQGPAKGPAVDGARDMFTYLCQYLTSLEAEVGSPYTLAMLRQLLLSDLHLFSITCACVRVCVCVCARGCVWLHCSRYTFAMLGQQLQLSDLRFFSSICVCVAALLTAQSCLLLRQRYLSCRVFADTNAAKEFMFSVPLYIVCPPRDCCSYHMMFLPSSVSLNFTISNL